MKTIKHLFVSFIFVFGIMACSQNEEAETINTDSDRSVEDNRTQEDDKKRNGVGINVEADEDGNVDGKVEGDVEFESK